MSEYTEPVAAQPDDRPIVVVTGMSGAGKSSALAVFEDMGFEVVDNLPLSLLPNLLRPASGVGGPEPDRPLAVCADVRTRQFDAGTFNSSIAPLLRDPALQTTLLFIDCENTVLRRRFNETRRRHPLTADRSNDDGIQLERDRLAWFRERADLVIDTSSMPVGEFRRVLKGHFAFKNTRPLDISVVSFAYRHGLPLEADLVFDVRFLRNPHYIKDLNPLSGREEAVGDYVRDDSAFQPFFDSLLALILSLLPAYVAEGKSYLTIAVGCTGGRHRSVFVAEQLQRALNTHDWKATLRHRDMEKFVADAPDQ